MITNPRHITVRNFFSMAIVAAIVLLQLADFVAEPYKKYASIALMIALLFVIPLRESFSYVFRKLRMTGPK